IVYRSELPRTGELREVEYSAVSEALHFACRDLRENRRRPIEITEDGIVVHDAHAIERVCESRPEGLSTELGHQGRGWGVRDRKRDATARSESPLEYRRVVPGSRRNDRTRVSRESQTDD